MTNKLLTWFKANARDLAWRRTKHPYQIWLSEIMLQQTRVDQATPYFLRFIEAYPTVQDLASADLDEVLKNWEGLGYYARARNMHHAAKQIVQEFGGEFPKTEAEIRTLKGVGAYTAAAVLSIAFGVPLAVLDGNVMRVLTRLFAIPDDIKQPKTREMLQVLAQELLDPNEAGNFNEAIMELGATICMPQNPRCLDCPIQTHCQAFAQNRQKEFPYSKKKEKVPHKQIAVGLIFNNEGKILINRRAEDGLLGGLWEFAGGKQEPNEALEETCRREITEELSIEVVVGEKIAMVNHAYTHFKITMHAFECQWISGTPKTNTGEPCKWISIDDLALYAFPKANRKVLEALFERKRNPMLF